MSEPAAQGVEPASLGELRLPPTFVTDHLIRTLSFQSSMSTMELARHWHVHVDIVAQVVEPLKAAGLLESESSKTNFEALNKARVNAARTRTWYAVALHRVGFGLLLIVAFSVGLASVLTAIGFALVFARRTPVLVAAEERLSGKAAGRFAMRVFPIFAAMAVIGAGAVIAMRAVSTL